MKKLAVFFPGIGYHCEKPLLYYAGKLLAELGYQDCIRLQYTCSAKNIRGNEKKIYETFEALYQQAAVQLQEVDWEAYDDVVFVSKSIGTVVSAAFAKRNTISGAQVLYTPLGLTAEFLPVEGIAFTGTADPWVEHEPLIASLQKKGMKSFIIEGADHSLETADTLANITNLLQVMQQTKEYLVQRK